MRDSRNLDLLRAIAVCLVVASHLRIPAGWTRDEVYNLEALGRLGVVLFFVHTTLVLLMSLQRSGDTLAPFMVRRVFRIYPLSCATVMLVYLPGLAGSTPFDWGQFVSNLLLVQNITGHPSLPGPLWTLPYEVQMYLFLPALYALTRVGRPKLTIALLCVTATGLGLLALATGLEARLVRFVPCFLPGALAFVLWRPRLSPLVLFGLVAASIVIVPAIVPVGKPDHPAFLIVSLLLGLAIPMCREIQDGWVARLAKIIATYSYGVYLTHVFALGIAFSAGDTGPLAWLTCAVMLVLLPLFAYVWIERPGIALGARLADRYRARMAAPRPAAMSPAASSAATPEVVRELVKSTTETALSSSR